MQNSEKKYEWADNMRAFATISVVILHVTAPILYLYGKIPNSYWWIGNVIDGMTRYCVPLFLMLSGALLIPKNENLTFFIKNRLPRILYPFLFWFTFYLIIHIYNTKSENITKIVWIDIQKGSSYHLWYIYMLLGIYLFIPIISEWIKKASNSEIIIFLTIWYLTLFNNYPLLASYKINIDLMYFSGYLGYVILGYFLIHRVNIKVKYSTIIYFLGTAITIYFTYYFTSKNNTYYKFFYNYLTPNVAFMSIGIFLIIKNITIKNFYIHNIIKFISQYNYGIYLAHVFILLQLDKINVNWKLGNPYFGIIFTTISALFITSYLIKFISILPYGKKISG